MNIKNFNSIQEYFEAHRAAVCTGALVGVLAVGVAVGTSSAAMRIAEKNDTPDTPDAAVMTADSPDIPAAAVVEPEPVETPDSPDTPETPEEPPPPPPPPPEKYKIKVPHLNQNNNLITGCELISTQMVLHYYGKKNITYDMIVKNTARGDVHVRSDGVWYGKSPDMAFIGDPTELSGMGCYPPVIEDTIANFMFDDLTTEITTGMELKELCDEYIANDIPVMIWVTTYMCDPQKGDTWKIMDENGKVTNEKFKWKLNEHCAVLTGYDKKYYYLADPLEYKDTVKYERKLVEKRYEQLGKMSIAVIKSAVVGKDDTKSAVDSKAETKSVLNSKADTKSAVDSKADTKSTADSKADTKSAVDSKADTKSAVDSKADTKSAVDSKADTKSAVDSKADAKSAVDSKADTKSAVDSKADTKSAVDSDAQIKSNAKDDEK